MEYDTIIVGAGMGGLSAGAFLAKESKKVLVIEKNDKPGGYVTSFSRGGYTFDAAIFHLTDIGENQTISQFVKFWGGHISAKKNRCKFRYFIGKREYVIDGKNAEHDLLGYFPEESQAIRKFFSISAKILDEMTEEGPPKPPYEMSLIEKLRFGAKSIHKRKTFLKYGMRSSLDVLGNLFKDKALASIIWGFYPVHSLLFLAHAFGWEMMKRDEIYYPEGGMQAIPDVTVETLEKNGGKLLLNTIGLQVRNSLTMIEAISSYSCSHYRCEGSHR